MREARVSLKLEQWTQKQRNQLAKLLPRFSYSRLPGSQNVSSYSAINNPKHVLAQVTMLQPLVDRMLPGGENACLTEKTVSVESSSQRGTISVVALSQLFMLMKVGEDELGRPLARSQTSAQAKEMYIMVRAMKLGGFSEDPAFGPAAQQPSPEKRQRSTPLAQKTN